MDIKEIKNAVAPICDRLRVKRLELFGSYAPGKERVDSDLDFCVLFDDLSPRDYSNKYFSLLHALEDAFKKPIDLLTAPSIKRRAFRQKLRKEKICLYG